MKTITMKLPDPYMSWEKAQERALYAFAQIFLQYWQGKRRSSKDKKTRASSHYDINPEVTLKKVKSFKVSLLWFVTYLAMTVALGATYVCLTESWPFSLQVILVVGTVVLSFATYIQGRANTFADYNWPGFTAFKVANAWKPWRKFLIEVRALESIRSSLQYGHLGADDSQRGSLGTIQNDTTLLWEVGESVRECLKSIADEIKKASRENRPLKLRKAERKMNRLMEFCSINNGILNGKERSDFFKNN